MRLLLAILLTLTIGCESDEIPPQCFIYYDGICAPCEGKWCPYYDGGDNYCWVVDTEQCWLYYEPCAEIYNCPLPTELDPASTEE